MQNYPVLRMLVRHGQTASTAAAGAVFLILAILLHPGFGLIGLAVAAVVGLAIYVLARSYIELVTLVSEMLAPQ